jgi:hypothetical protein
MNAHAQPCLYKLQRLQPLSKIFQAPEIAFVYWVCSFPAACERLPTGWFGPIPAIAAGKYSDEGLYWKTLERVAETHFKLCVLILVILLAVNLFWSLGVLVKVELPLCALQSHACTMQAITRQISSRLY